MDSILALIVVACIGVFVVEQLYRYSVYSEMNSLRARKWRSGRSRTRAGVRAREGFIYCWRDYGAGGKKYVKIGRTNDLKKRLKTFQTAQADSIDIIAVIFTADDVHTEKMLHEKFKAYRVRGEFFQDVWVIRRWMSYANDRALFEAIYSELYD